MSEGRIDRESIRLMGETEQVRASEGDSCYLCGRIMRVACVVVMLWDVDVYVYVYLLWC